MGLATGIGVGIQFSRGGSQSWESYWEGNLIVTVLSDSSIKLDWIITTDDHDGHEIERTSDPLGLIGWEVIAKVIGSVATYTDTGLAGNYYYYRIRAYKGEIYSGYCTAVKNDRPTILYTNTMCGEYDWQDDDNIEHTLNEISAWKDKLGLGNDLLQAEATKFPLLTSEGILFDGNNDYLKGVFTFNQPAAIYIVLKQLIWTDGRIILDGAAAAAFLENHETSSPNVAINAGAYSSSSDKFTVNDWHIVRILFYGAYSWLIIDNETPIIENTGANNLGGLTLGALRDGTLAANICIRDVLLRTYRDTPYAKSVLYNYLKIKESLSIASDGFQSRAENYLSYLFGAFIGWGFGTYAGGDFPGPDQDPDIFAPTSGDVQGMIDDWLDTFVDAGMSYAVFIAKSNAGWCMWPTSFADSLHDPYSIAVTTWYANNGSPDILEIFVDGCNSKGIKPVIYYSILDTTHEVRSGTDEKTDPTAYMAMITTQLTELLSNYGDIAGIWLDGLKWHISYSDIPYEPIFNLINGLQPNCTVINNEHLLPTLTNTLRTDIICHELVAAADDIVPLDNRTPSEELHSIRLDQQWVYTATDDQTAAALLDKDTINLSKLRANERFANYMLTVTPDYAGLLPAAQKTLLGSLNNDFEDEIVAYITHLTTPISMRMIKLLNIIVCKIKAGFEITNLSDHFDWMYLIGGETSESSVINLVKNDYHGTLVDSPTFTKYEGIAGNGSTSCIDVNYNAAIDGDNYTLNNGSIGIYSRTNIAEASADIGVREGGNDIVINTRVVNTAYARINNSSTHAKTGTNNNSTGLYIVTRNGPLKSDLYFYKNKNTVFSTDATDPASVAIPNDNIFICARSDGSGNPAAFSTRQYAFAFQGKHITTAQRDIIYDALQEYMTLNGKEV